MTPIFTLPGIGNSGPSHWQTLWERQHPRVKRIEQHDWDHPRCDAWVAAIDAAVATAAAPPLVVAHSLGCLALAHWAAGSARPVAGLMMVAVPDAAGPHFPAEALGFGPLPASLGDRRITLVGSLDDPYATPDFGRDLARRWAAAYVGLGRAGHINAQSGLGDWDFGWQLALQHIA